MHQACQITIGQEQCAQVSARSLVVTVRTSVLLEVVIWQEAWQSDQKIRYAHAPSPRDPDVHHVVKGGEVGTCSVTE